MSAYLIRLLVLGNALFLALPPGWCCTSPPAERPAPQEQGCCHCTPKQNPDDSAPAPTLPQTRCCCRTDSTSPPQPEGFAPETTSFVTTVAADLDLGHDLGSEFAVSSPSPSRPLQILHCVWRC